MMDANSAMLVTKEVQKQREAEKEGEFW
jgi:hypothetical protein